MQSRANLERLRLRKTIPALAQASSKMFQWLRFRAKCTGSGGSLSGNAKSCKFKGRLRLHLKKKTILDPAPNKMFKRLPAPDKMCRLRWPGSGSASLLERLLSDLEGPLRPISRALSYLERCISDLGWTLMDQGSPLKPSEGILGHREAPPRPRGSSQT